MRRALLLFTLLCGGCGYEYAQNIRPVSGVEPYGGREFKQDKTGALGMVYAEAEGNSCDEAVAAAMTKLLEQTKAMGGARVIHAQTRSRHNWSGHLSCRGMSNHVSARGVAMPAKTSGAE
jgi:hypothetical protein